MKCECADKFRIGRESAKEKKKGIRICRCSNSRGRTTGKISVIDKITFLKPKSNPTTILTVRPQLFSFQIQKEK